MRIQGTGNQPAPTHLYRADLTLSGSAQLVLGRSMSRSSLILQNLSLTSNSMWVEIGDARATATLTNGKVTGFSITNAGFGYTRTPQVMLLGGGQSHNSSYVGLAQPNAPVPEYPLGHPASVRAVLTAGAISSFIIDDAGSGYVVPPYVFILGDQLDPNGCAVPSAGVGLQLLPGTPPVAWNGTTCITGPISVFGTSSDALFCGWTD